MLEGTYYEYLPALMHVPYCALDLPALMRVPYLEDVRDKTYAGPLFVSHIQGSFFVFVANLQVCPHPDHRVCQEG